jgi:hypothetical protein
MFFLTLLRDYMLWHYGAGLIAFVRVYKNFWWFLVQFFSIPQLTASLVAPYKKMTEGRGSLLDIEWWIGFIIINTISRLLGLIIRLIIITTGLICLMFFSLTALISYGVWLIAPLLLVYCFSYGLYLVLS